MVFEDLKPIGTKSPEDDTSEHQLIPEAEDPNLIGEIQEYILEPYEPEKENEESWLNRMITKLKAKKDAQEKKRREKAWLATEEGKRWQAQEKERIEAEKRASELAEAIYAERLLEAKRQIILEEIADAHLKKHPIKDNDDRIPRIMGELDRIRQAVAAAFYK